MAKEVMVEPNSPSWQMLRSDIYIRDKGICWICNTFVALKDYDLGHLVDRCNGGQDDYDNLAVMHKSCNLSKPRHTSLEEAMKWKLTPQYLITRPQRYSKPPQPITQITLSQLNKAVKVKVKRKSISSEDYLSAEELVIEYFNSHPELLTDGYNPARTNAIKQISDTLQITLAIVYKILKDSGMVKPSVKVRDGSQYRYVVEHLHKLTTQYKSYLNKDKAHPLTHKTIMKELGITSYQVRILFYLLGMEEHLCIRDRHSIQIRLAQLHIDFDAIQANICPSTEPIPDDKP